MAGDPLHPVLDIDVSARFGAFRLETRFSSSGLITALFGRSGAGKTSVVNLMAGLAGAERGRIVVNGRVLFDSENGIALPPERRRLGYVFQDARLFPHLSVRGNLRYGMIRVPAGERVYDFERIVELLGLGPLLDRRPAGLSGGERQRVAIGRALLTSPRLLLMDEPLASVDAARRDEVLGFVERMRDQLGIPIVYVSHVLEEVVRLADTLVLLSEGRVAAVGGVEELMNRLDLRPITGRYEAGAVIAATVRAQDEDFALTELEFAGNRLRVPRLDLPEGSSIRVRIRARDVSLSLAPPERTSVLNIFEGRIAEVGAGDGAQLDVLVDVGAPLIARVTRRSVHDLGLAPGIKVYAMVKSVAIDRHSVGGRGSAAGGS